MLREEVGLLQSWFVVVVADCWREGLFRPTNTKEQIECLFEETASHCERVLRHIVETLLEKESKLQRELQASFERELQEQ